jgi:GGDEF domain-containing protein
MRLLLVERDAWDAGLIQEAIDELDEHPQEKILPRPIDLFHAENLTEATASVEHEQYDLILLDPTDAGLQSFLQLRDAAPRTPILMLVPRAEETLALSAVREGAAGYLLKEDVDCLPLARGIRAALERHQALTAREEQPNADELTGLTSKHGFLYLGDMALRLATRWNKPARLSVINLTGYRILQDVYGSQARDLALIETADMLRDLFPDSDLLARTGPTQFSALSIGPTESLRPLPIRINTWLDKRAGRPGHPAPLEFDAFEEVFCAGDHSLSELLNGALPRQAAAAMRQ